MATPELSAPTVGASGEPCTVCGAPLAADQRYCLNCGERRAGVPLGLEELAPAPPAPPAAGEGPAAAAAGTPGRSIPLTPATAAAGVGSLLVAVLLGAGIAGLTSKTPEVNVPAAKAPVVNVAGGSAAAADTAVAAAAEFTGDWSGEGWTIELQSLPKDGTDPAAVQAAKDDATAKGAADVGALDSDEYPTLDPGTFVVYSGVYATKKEASAALKGLKGEFPGAKVVKVSATESGGSDDAAADTGGNGADTADSKDLQDLNSASGDEFVDKSKKLKDTTAIEGPPPPKDDKPAGGGDEGEVLE